MAEKKARRKGPMVLEPMKIMDIEGHVIEVNTYEDQLRQALLATEDNAVESLAAVLRSDNETAIVSASKKVVEMGNDSDVPAKLRKKLLKFQLEAIAALQSVAMNGKVSTARSEAAGFLVKMQKQAAPAQWPPDTMDPKWISRMKRAEELCAISWPV